MVRTKGTPTRHQSPQKSVSKFDSNANSTLTPDKHLSLQSSTASPLRTSLNKSSSNAKWALMPDQHHLSSTTTPSRTMSALVGDKSSKTKSSEKVQKEVASAIKYFTKGKDNNKA